MGTALPDCFELTADMMGAHLSLGTRTGTWTLQYGYTLDRAWDHLGTGPGHVELIVQSSNLDADNASPAVNPGTKEPTRRSPGSQDEDGYLCEGAV